MARSGGALSCRQDLRTGPERPILHVNAIDSMVMMDTPSTPSDRKRIRRSLLAAAAGLLAGGLVVFVAFHVFTRPNANERAADLARKMVDIQDLDEIQATIIPRFEQETGCHFVFYLPFYGPTLNNVARQATGFTNRLRGISTTATGVGFGEATGFTTLSSSDNRAEYRYTAFAAVVDCKAPYLDPGW